MARHPVLQPDGKLAIYGTVVDNFVALDCTEDQAIAQLVTWYGPEHVADLERVVKLCAAGQQVFEWWEDWPHRLAWAMRLHGVDDSMVAEAWARTPDPMTRRYIEQFVATCKAESHADDLNTELIAARQRIAELEAGQRNAQQSIDYLQSERERMNTRIAELEAVLSYIDAHAPLADATCDEPGITLSEAARRAIKESQP